MKLLQEQCECNDLITPDLPPPTSFEVQTWLSRAQNQLEERERPRAGAGQARPATHLRLAIFSLSGSTEVTLPGAWEGDRLRLPPPTFCLASWIAEAITSDLQETPRSEKQWPREQHTCLVLFYFLLYHKLPEVSVILMLIIRKLWVREVSNHCMSKPGLTECLLCDWKGVSSQCKEIEI